MRAAGTRLFRPPPGPISATAGAMIGRRPSDGSGWSMMSPMREPNEALALLGRSRLFKQADPAELTPLLQEARWRKYAADSFVFRQDDPADHMLIVAGGQVKISRSTEGGTEVVFAVLGPGDAFGELGALEEGATRSADAKA